jgi:hypothetical protein
MEGREPVEVTEYEYDDAGRMVRSTTIREPEWTEQDTAEVFALAAHRATLCPCCGLPKAMVQVHEQDLPEIVVESKTCWARKKQLKEQAALGKKKISEEALHSLQWSIRVKE